MIIVTHRENSKMGKNSPSPNKTPAGFFRVKPAALVKYVKAGYKQTNHNGKPDPPGPYIRSTFRKSFKYWSLKGKYLNSKDANKLPADAFKTGNTPPPPSPGSAPQPSPGSAPPPSPGSAPQPAPGSTSPPASPLPTLPPGSPGSPPPTSPSLGPASPGPSPGPLPPSIPASPGPSVPAQPIFGIDPADAQKAALLAASNDPASALPGQVAAGNVVTVTTQAGGLMSGTPGPSSSSGSAAPPPAPTPGHGAIPGAGGATPSNLFGVPGGGGGGAGGAGLPTTTATGGAAGGGAGGGGGSIDYNKMTLALSHALQANKHLFATTPTTVVNPTPVTVNPTPVNVGGATVNVPPPAHPHKKTGVTPQEPKKISEDSRGESNRGEPRQIVDQSEIKQDDVLKANEVNRELGLTVQDESTATLRPLYGIAGAADHIPSVDEQLRSDIEFDLFNVVQPGHGLGSDNKMFLYQQARDNVIRYRQPMYTPNQYLGPSNYQHPLPWQWQNVKAVSDVTKSLAQVTERIRKVAALVDRMGEKTTEAFGRDVGEAPASISSSGLKRDKNSPFEPVIQLRHAWSPILDPVGKDLDQRRGYKRLFSALRDPDTIENQVRNGGPTLSKRRALEVILP